MCECGCGEFHPFARFPGPEGVTYTLSVYTCMTCGCGNPAGFIVTRITADLLARWGMEPEMIDRLPWVDFDDRTHDAFFALIHPDGLREALALEFLHEPEVTDALEVTDVAEVLQQALRNTAAKNPLTPEPPHA